MILFWQAHYTFLPARRILLIDELKNLVVYNPLVLLNMNRRSGTEYDKDGNLLQKDLLVKLMLNRST